MAVKRYYTREGFVYVPELKMNGRNWKEYRKQVLEVARIQNVIGHLAGVEQKPKVAGKELNEWLQQNSSAQFILMWNIPDSLFSHIQHFEMAHEMFDYLATTFRDHIPIPLPTTKPVEASSGDVAADEPPSTNDLQEQKDGSAFEAHASGDDVQDEPRESCAKPNESSMELPRMERLEDGLTEARSNDEAEAAVGMAQQVTSRGIEVKDHIPEVPSEPRTAQNELHEQPSSRAGEPLERKHPEMVKVPVGVDKMAKLASEPAEHAKGIDKSNKMVLKDLPQTLCSEGTKDDMPNTRRLPLEGEQALCTSGNTRNSNGIEDEQPRLVDGKCDNHRGGTDSDTPSASSSITNEQNGYASSDIIKRPQRIYRIPHRRGRLKMTTVDISEAKSDVPDARRLPLEGELAGCASDNSENSEATITLLQGEQNVNGRSSEAAIAPLQGEQNANGPNALTATPSMSNEGETLMAVPQNFSIDGNTSTYRGTQWLDETDSLRKHVNMSSYEMDALGIAYGTNTASNMCQNVRTCQMKPEIQDLPRGLENESPDPTMPWRRLGIGGANISVPRGMPIETSSTPNQNATFGRPASADEGSATRGVEGETAGNGKRSNGDGDGTTSSGDVNSMRVEVAMLAGDSQITCYGQNSSDDLLMSPWPLPTCREHSRALIRPKRRRGRIKIESGNVSRAQKLENGHYGQGNAMRLILRHREGIGTCLNPTFKCWKQGERRRHTRNRCDVNPNMLRRPRGPGGQGEVQEVLGHVETDGIRCQMDGATSSMRCDSKRVETRLLAEDQAGQYKQQRWKPSDIPGPPATRRKRSHALIRPKRRRGRIKDVSKYVSKPRKLENAHKRLGNAIRPILRHREGIGTCQDLAVKFRTSPSISQSRAITNGTSETVQRPRKRCNQRSDDALITRTT